MLKTFLNYYILNLCIEVLFNRISARFPSSMNIKVGDKFSYIRFFVGDKRTVAREYICTYAIIVDVINSPNSNNITIQFTFETYTRILYKNNKIHKSITYKEQTSFNFISNIIEIR